MPIIPIPRQSPIAAAPGAVLDRNRRPTVDTSDQQRAVGQVARNAQQPLMDPRATAAPYEALGSVGRAIADTGSVIGALAVKREEARTEVQVARATNEFVAHLGDYEARKAKMLPELWEETWQKELPELRKRILAAPNLTPKAAERIGLAFDARSTQVFAGIQLDTARREFGDARDVFESKTRTSIVDQNREGFEESLAVGVRNGWIQSDMVPEYERQYKQAGVVLQNKVKADGLDAARNDVIMLTEQSGKGAGQSFVNGIKGDILDSEAKETLMRLAESVDDRKRNLEQDALVDGLFAPENPITSAARIDQIANEEGRKPFLSPKAVAHVKGMLADMDQEKARVDRENNGPRNAVALRHEARAYDPKGDPDDLGYLTLRQRVHSEVPEGLRNSVLDVLENRHSGQPVPVRKEIRDYIRSTLDRMYDPYAVGWRTDEIDPKTGNFKAKDDPIKEQEAIDSQTDVEIKMEDWLQMNPNPKRQEVEDQLNKFRSGADDKAFLERAMPASAMDDSLPRKAPKAFAARATGYFPVDPDHPAYKMEGGRVGAQEWHGEPVKQEPLHTLEDFREGKAPYVSVAMDNSASNPLPYGTKLKSPQFPGVVFRVMDTGSAFNGKTTKYGPAKGLNRIDIARRSSAGANSKENNRNISFVVI